MCCIGCRAVLIGSPNTATQNQPRTVPPHTQSEPLVGQLTNIALFLKGQNHLLHLVVHLRHVSLQRIGA